MVAELNNHVSQNIIEWSIFAFCGEASDCEILVQRKGICRASHLWSSNEKPQLLSFFTY